MQEEEEEEEEEEKEEEEEEEEPPPPPIIPPLELPPRLRRRIEEGELRNRERPATYLGVQHPRARRVTTPFQMAIPFQFAQPEQMAVLTTQNELSAAERDPTTTQQRLDHLRIAVQLAQQALNFRQDVAGVPEQYRIPVDADYRQQNLWRRPFVMAEPEAVRYLGRGLKKSKRTSRGL